MTYPEPDEAIRLALEDGVRLRGWIVNSYAQIEFALGDLILRCRAFPEYEAQTRTFTHSSTTRVAKVRAMLDIAGPLDQFAADLRGIMDRFEANHETRNLLTHGFCTFLITPRNEMGFYFQKFHRPAAKDDAILSRTFTPEALDQEHVSTTALGQESLVLFSAIHAHFGWTRR